MDVLHVIHQFPPESRGGSESYLLDVAQRQRARGLDAQVLTGTMHARPAVILDPAEDVEGIPVHRLHRNDLYFDHHAKMWHPEVEQMVADRLAAWRPKLLHIHHWVRLTCNLAEIATRFDIPVVITLHDYYTSCPRAFRRRLGNAIEDLSCRRVLSAASCSSCVPVYGHEPAHELGDGVELFADHFRAEVSLARAALVAVSSTADLLAEMTGMPRNRYEVLPLGYHPRFHGMPRLAPPRAGEPLRFAFWGTIGRHKGVDVLLHAFRKVAERRPGEAELHVLGQADSEKFDGELRPLGAGLPVTFHGPFDAATLHATAPHVGVFPSTCIETYGLVLDECFELGRPCITSDLGAVAERGAAAGLASRAGDAESLAAAMLRFVDEPDLWPGLAAKVPPLALNRDEHLERLLAIYERARTGPAHAPAFASVPPLRRIMFLQKQRETALDRIRDHEGPV
ncbi:MAG: glycosyltransferase [Planctomycetes bacterium]|nr:glycosyltransferase [Planctomycetota bacterium]